MTDETTVPEPADGSDAPAEATTTVEPSTTGAPPSADELVSSTPPVKKRNRNLAVIITVVVVVIVGGAAAAVTTFLLNTAAAIAKPTVYVSQSYGYTVTLPGKPTVVHAKSTLGPSERIQWTGIGGQTVTVEALKLASAIPSDRIPAVLDGGLSGGVKAINGTDVRDVKKFTLDGQPAASEIATTSVAGDTYLSIVVKGTYLYSIVITRSTATLQKSVDASFSFTG